MSNLKIVDNNASTTVAVQLLSGGTTLTVATGEGALFSTIAAPNIMHLTLDGGNGIEIVQVTTHTAAADVFTIVRAQEGTAAVQYEIGETVELRLTKEYLDSLIQLDNGGDAKGTDSINIQASRVTSSNVASGTDSIAIGSDSEASATNSIAIGSDSATSAASSTSIGHGATTNVSETTNIAGPIIVRDNGILPSMSSASQRTLYGSAAQIVICTEAIQTTSTSDVQVDLPADFFLEEVGAIAVDVDTMTVQPIIAFATASFLTNIVAPVITTELDAVGKRERYTAPLLDTTANTTNIFARITTAATATSLKVRFYFKGFMIESSITNS